MAVSYKSKRLDYSPLRFATINLSIVAIFYPFSQFFEIDSCLLSLQKQQSTAPNLFQRGVEYGKYEKGTPWRFQGRIDVD